MKKKFEFGKIDFSGSGRKVNAVDVEVELRDTPRGPEFSACGNVWNSKHTDVVMAGQCLDDLACYVKNPIFLKIHGLWKRNHLNSMHAGDREQEALLKEAFAGKRYDYDEACRLLKEAGIYEHNGYRYGSGWVYEPISDGDMKEIQALLA